MISSLSRSDASARAAMADRPIGSNAEHQPPFRPLAPNPAIGELMSGRDPILVMFDGSAEQIHAASRTRISGLIMDLMLIQSLGQAVEGRVSSALPST